jgi:hypothetical protein
MSVSQKLLKSEMIKFLLEGHIQWKANKYVCMYVTGDKTWVYGNKITTMMTSFP